MRQDCQNKFVEKFPLIFEEEAEKSTRDVGVGFGEDTRENAENPVAGVHLGADVVFFEVVV